MATTAAKTAKFVEVDFNYEKDTPGTSRFKETEPKAGEAEKIGTLYLKKATMEFLGNPTTIKVRVETTPA